MQKAELGLGASTRGQGDKRLVGGAACHLERQLCYVLHILAKRRVAH